ncbi:Destabilase, partial [Oesophagostomum dentatum]
LLQIKLPYYQDCGTPGRKSGEDITAAWKRCSDNLECATKCVQAYYARYKSQCSSTGQGECQVMARNHNGGPTGCLKVYTALYWAVVVKCCNCA